MRYDSVCSGIEAATVAWHPLGWAPHLYAEIDAFPRTVLRHHYPDVPLLGDFTALLGSAAPDARGELLVGGTPCQAFSLSGRRLSLEDYRGNLTLAFADLSLTRRYPYTLWENVPGVLSTRDNAFGCFLGRLVGHDAPLCAPGWRRGVGSWPRAGVVDGPAGLAAWRVLDAQWYGVAQRRRRVFVLVSRDAGAWTAAEALLPLAATVRRDPPPRSPAGQATTGSLAARAGGGGWPDGGDGRHSQLIVGALVARGGTNGGGSNADLDAGHVIAFGGNRTGGPLDVAAALRASDSYQGDFETDTILMFKPSHYTRDPDGRPDPIAPALRADADRGDQEAVALIPFDPQQLTHPANRARCEPGAPTPALKSSGHHLHIAFDCKRNASDSATAELSPTLTSMAGARPNSGGQLAALEATGIVRRLTPRECERLQGFPDDYTLVPYGRKGRPAKDGPRYRALGNSMAVPVMRWLGRQLMRATTTGRGD